MEQFIVGGLITGSILGISAIALVLTYNTSKIFNFALPGMAYFLAYIYYELAVKLDLPIPISLLITVLGAGAGLGLALYWVVFRHLERAQPFVRITVTVGLQVALVSGAQLAFGSQAIDNDIGIFRGRIPVEHVAGVAINGNQLVALLIGIVIAASVPLVMRWTTAGLLLRAVVDDAGASRRAGVRVPVVGACSWMVACAIAAIVGIAITPIVNLDASAISGLIVASFAGAVIGALTNMALAFSAALLIGVAQGVILPYLPSTGVIGTGLRPSLPFVFIILAIVAYRMSGHTEALEEETGIQAQASAVPLVRPSSGATLWPPIALVGVALLSAFLFPVFWIGELGASIALGVVFLSWKLVGGEGGMVSLAQATFAAVGAVAAAQFASVEHWPIGASVALGAGIAGLIGAVLGVLALRLSAVYAALATYAFALFFDNFIFADSRFNPFQAGVPLPRVSIDGFSFHSNRSYYFLALAVFVAMATLLRNLRRSETGLVLATARASRLRSKTLGISVPLVRTSLFCLGAVVAGLGGTLYSMFQFSAQPLAFTADTALLWFAIVMLWGPSSTMGCIVSGLSVVALPQLLDLYVTRTVAESLPILFGLGVIGLASHPEGAAERLRAALVKVGQRLLRQDSDGMGRHSSYITPGSNQDGQATPTYQGQAETLPS